MLEKKGGIIIYKKWEYKEYVGGCKLRTNDGQKQTDMVWTHTNERKHIAQI